MRFSSVFNYDSPIWCFLGRIADAFLLTILWLVFSMPIITIGASTTALYASALRMMRNEDSSIVKEFATDFKINFKQGTIAFLIMAAVGLAIGNGLFNLYQARGELPKLFMVSVLIFAYLYLMIFKFIFPVVARFSNTLGNLFVISFILATKYFGWTMMMVTLTVTIIVAAIFAFWPILIFSMGAIAIVDAIVLNNIFYEFAKAQNIE